MELITLKCHSKTYLASVALLSLYAAVLLTGCSKHSADNLACGSSAVRVIINTGAGKTKTLDPDETLISDLNIFLFDGKGRLEEARFIPKKELCRTDNGVEYDFTWLADIECQVFACANFGFKMSGINSIDDLENFRYHLAYPDEYSRGIPMSGKSEKILVTEQTGRIDLKLERMMSKISVSINRTKLNKGISFNIKGISIGGCPRSANVFKSSKALNSNDIFTKGFSKNYIEADGLNIDEQPGISKEVSVYMLENMQGEILPNTKDENDKVLDSLDAVSKVCSYIELQAEYKSDSLYSAAENYLIYRFYLGDKPSNFDVERNCHYHISVIPEKDGLNGTGWRIDKSNLTAYGSTAITVYPGKYVSGKVGDDLHIWAEVQPAESRLTFGKEELEYDKERGIYDYTMDADNRGVTLHLKNPGTGIIYIEAGAPANSAEMVYVTVNK